jgi:lipoprotein-releasing system ATP-binding protein
MSLILKNINKSFSSGDNKIQVLKDISLEIKSGEIAALVGPSGSGKTTLLQIAGLLDNADSGEVYINSKNLSTANDKQRTETRKNEVGFIYQFHHLLPEFSALENVAMPLLIRKIEKKEAFMRSEKILEELGLKHRITHRPAELSGGEQQRVSIARAIVGKPSLLLADEPTGNLDSENAENIFNLLTKFTKKYQMACLVVTHNSELAQKMDRIITIRDGALL